MTDAGQAAEKILAILQEYALVLLLILVAELVVGWIFFALFTKLLGLSCGFGGWVVGVLLTPYLHHLSHGLPLVGFIISTVLLSLVLGSIYKKRVGQTRQSVGCGTGFFLVVVRLIIHYAVILGGIFVFAAKMISDLQAELG